MNENQINKSKMKLPIQLTLNLLFKHMHNKKISESILKEIELINISLFKYINEAKNNEKRTELKMIYINKCINNILYKKEKTKKSLKNLSAKISKKNYTYLTSMENNKNTTNPDITDNYIDNSILKFKMIRKIKNEHDKFMIKELEYLQRISELQSQLKLYEKTIEQLIIENNQINNEINLNNDVNNTKMNKTNSVSDLPLKDDNIVKNIIDIKNKRKSNKINNFHPSSNDHVNKSMRSLKRDNFIIYKKNKNNIDSYSKINISKNNNNRPKYTAHLVNLNYKYEVGNAYLRNKFFKLKKDIKEETLHLKKIKDLLNDIK